VLLTHVYPYAYKTRKKRYENDTKTIKMDTVSVKNVKNQYGFVLPSLTSLLHAPLGASAKAILWITWPQKARQTAPKMCFSENENATYVKNGNRETTKGHTWPPALAGA
jgi:hypothetical protein